MDIDKIIQSSVGMNFQFGRGQPPFPIYLFSQCTMRVYAEVVLFVLKKYQKS